VRVFHQACPEPSAWILGVALCLCDSAPPSAIWIDTRGILYSSVFRAANARDSACRRLPWDSELDSQRAVFKKTFLRFALRARPGARPLRAAQSADFA